MKLKQLMICLDCDEVELIATHCPICSSKSVVELAKWIPPLDSVPPKTPLGAVLQECRDMHRKLMAMQLDDEQPLGIGA